MGDNSLLKALALATQLGFAVACPLVVFIAGGVWADGQLGTKPWLFFLGLVLGIAAAAAALYQIAVAGSGKRTSARTRHASRPPGAEDDAGTNHASDQAGDRRDQR